MSKIPSGIISVLQTPFTPEMELDEGSLFRLIEDAVESGVDGFLVPAVASEVAALTTNERDRVLEIAVDGSSGRVPIIAGASSEDVETCLRYASRAQSLGATAYLVAVPLALYSTPKAIPGFFESISNGCELPLIVQDLQFGGPGMDMETIQRVSEKCPTFLGIKVETAPSGPKYTAVKKAFGPDFFVAGGWAVPQMIEALDRGVDGMIPESSMVRVYSAIYAMHLRGERESAVDLFNRLQPVLAFSNQELYTSIGFFKRLLVRKGIFKTALLRPPGFEWDEFNSRIADDLIDHYLLLEKEMQTQQSKSDNQ